MQPSGDRNDGNKACFTEAFIEFFFEVLFCCSYRGPDLAASCTSSQSALSLPSIEQKDAECSASSRFCAAFVLRGSGKQQHNAGGKGVGEGLGESGGEVQAGWAKAGRSCKGATTLLTEWTIQVSNSCLPSYYLPLADRKQSKARSLTNQAFALQWQES